MTGTPGGRSLPSYRNGCKVNSIGHSVRDQIVSPGLRIASDSPLFPFRFIYFSLRGATVRSWLLKLRSQADQADQLGIGEIVEVIDRGAEGFRFGQLLHFGKRFIADDRPGGIHRRGGVGLPE